MTTEEPTAAPAPPLSTWLSTTEAAAELYVSTRTLRRYLADGIPGAVKDQDSGIWRIPGTWVEARLAERRAAHARDVPLLRSAEAIVDLRIDASDPDPGADGGLGGDRTERLIRAEARAARAEAHIEAHEHAARVHRAELERERQRRDITQDELDELRQRYESANAQIATYRAERDHARELLAFGRGQSNAEVDQLRDELVVLRDTNDALQRSLGALGRRRLLRARRTDT